jgi:hypothetical protein
LEERYVAAKLVLDPDARPAQLHRTPDALYREKVRD